MAYTTEELVEAELGGFTVTSTSNPSSDELSSWIGQAKAEIDNRTGETYEPVLVTQEVYDYSNIDNILRLKNSNIISITTLEYNGLVASSTPTWTEKTENTHFTLYGDFSEVQFINSTFSPKSGINRFRVTYTYGTSTLPKQVQMLATKIVAKRVVDSVINSQASVSGGAVSVGTLSVDDPSMFSPGVSKGLKEDINELFSKIIGSFKTYKVIRDY